MNHDHVVFVAGGRDHNDWPTFANWMDGFHARRPITLLLHGACRDKDGKLIGCDAMAERWAITREVPYVGWPAPWETFRREGRPVRAAGPVRNRRAARHFRPKTCVLFPGGSGTASAGQECAAVGALVVRAA